MEPSSNWTQFANLEPAKVGYVVALVAAYAWARWGWPKERR